MVDLVWVKTPYGPSVQKWTYDHKIMVTDYWDDLIISRMPLNDMDGTLPLWELAQKYPLSGEK